MSRQIQIRRGTATEHENFTGAIGELTMDTTANTLRLHDGQTCGGIAMARQDELPPTAADYIVEYQRPTSDNSYTWYRKYSSGWVEQGGLSKFETATRMPITMANSSYTVTVTPSSSVGGAGVWTQDRTTSTFKTRGQNYSGAYISGSNVMSWRVSGFAA